MCIIPSFLPNFAVSKAVAAKPSTATRGKIWLLATTEKNAKTALLKV